MLNKMTLEKIIKKHETLKERRRKKGITQQSMADALGITVKQYHKWENELILAKNLEKYADKIEQVEKVLNKGC